MSNPGGERFGLGITNCRALKEVIEAARRGDALGAEIAFVAEDINCRDAFQLGALCAMQTRQIRVATGVINPYTRNPTSIAMAIATLDEASNGRATLGIGTSSPSLIQDQMGIPVQKPLTVMRESTELVRALLSGEPVTYRGESFNYADARLEVRPVQVRIPIFFAAMGPQMLRLAGRVADGVLLNVGASTDYIRWAVAQVERGAIDMNRDPSEVTIAAWLTAYVTDDYAAALQRARSWLATILSVPRQGELLLEKSHLDVSILDPIRSLASGYPHGGDPVAAAEHVPPEVAERLTLIGTPDQVRSRIDDYRAAGVQLPVMGISVLNALFGRR